MTFEDFRGDRKTVDAVVRNLEVLGEAARHVPTAERERLSEVPWCDIAGMRDVLIHEYFGADVSIIWATIQNDLPTLRPSLERLLETNP
jgi:uncharacterized protein with HEPN domain